MRNVGSSLVNLILTVIGFVAFLMTVRAALYIHGFAHAWETPAIFAALAIAAIVAIFYVRYRRFGRPVLIAVGLSLSFSVILGLLHGWGSGFSPHTLFTAFMIVVVVVYIVLTCLVAAVVIATARARKRQADALREIGKAVRGTALFRDDGERMTFYPNRTGTLQSFLRISILASLFGAAFVWWPEHSLRDTMGHWVFAIGCSYSAAFALALLYRAVVRRPTLTVGPDGLIDNGSLFATGVGRLGWDEILAITTAKASSSRFAPKTLVIFLLDARAVRKRMPLVKRLASIVNGPRSFVLRIWPYLLDQPVDAVAERIKCYAESHAPEGWFGDDGEDDGPDTTVSTTSE